MLLPQPPGTQAACDRAATQPSAHPATVEGSSPTRQEVIEMYTYPSLRSAVLAGMLLMPLAACDQRNGEASADLPGKVSVLSAAVRTSYTGQCPPSIERAPSFTAIISVASGPTTVTYQWLTSDGSSTDPDIHDLYFPGDGVQHAVVTFTETGYLPDQTRADWIALYIRSPLTVESNHLPFTTRCRTGHPHRLDPDTSGS
jgi:hypothetical protein